MKTSVLSSGSKGNCLYIETKKHKLLIDIGTTCLYVENSLKEMGINPKDIDIVFVTHAHKDHVGGLQVFIKKYNPLVYLTEKIEKEAKLKINNKRYFDGPVKLDGLLVTPIKTSHDVTDSYGYLLEENDKSLVYITDTGYIHKKYFDLLRNRNIYIFESNHDVTKLMNNPKYPYHIKIRILSDKGHLSNEDSSRYLSEFVGLKTKKIVLAHLSEENNTEDLAIDTLKHKLTKKIDIAIAHQNEKTELIEI